MLQVFISCTASKGTIPSSPIFVREFFDDPVDLPPSACIKVETGFVHVCNKAWFDSILQKEDSGDEPLLIVHMLAEESHSNSLRPLLLREKVSSQPFVQVFLFLKEHLE